MDVDESKSSDVKLEIGEGSPSVVSNRPSSPKKEEGSEYGVLPEGFFDDARKDAEARNVPFRDKMDAEMEAFQKELGALNNVCCLCYHILCCLQGNLLVISIM